MERVLEPEVMDTTAEAEAYDAMDHSMANDAFVHRLLELGACGRVLDIGCGPGHIALQLVTQNSSMEVLGIDLSHAMLAIAEEHRAVCTHAERVKFATADAKQLPYAEGSFQTVCSNTILHHLANPVPFLREAWRVLESGGVLLIRDLFRPENMDMVEHLVSTYAATESPKARALFRASLCAALTPDEFLQAARAAGIENAEVVEDSDRHMSLQSCRA